MKKLLVFIILSTYIIACKDYERSFVNKYEHEDFTEFINTSVHQRGYDKDGNLILMVSTNTDYGRPIIFIVDKKNKIKATSYTLALDSMIIDKNKADRIALKFLNYKIFSLSVDSSNNVYVRLKETDRPRLAKFSDIKYVKTADVFKSEWSHLKGNWYKAKD